MVAGVTGPAGSGTGVTVFEVDGSIAAVTGTAINWAGAWSSLTAYNYGDGVSYNNGSTYLCIQANTNQNPLTATQYWVLLAQRGSLWSEGSGAPGVLAGQLNNDMYLNVTDGGIWQLQSGTWVLVGFISVPNIFYPEAYGALGNGSHDDTTAIQAAINAAAANNGGTVVFGPKTYLITAALTISNTGVCLQGASYGGSTVIETASAGNDFISVNVSGSQPSQTINSIAINYLITKRTSTPTGTAAGIRMNAVNGPWTINNCTLLDNIYGVHIHGVNNGNLDNTWSINSAGSGNRYGFYLDSTDGVPNNSIRINYCYGIASGSVTMYGLYSTGTALNDLLVDRFETAECSYGVYMSATGSASAFSNQDIHFRGCLHDGYLHRHTISRESMEACRPSK